MNLVLGILCSWLLIIVIKHVFGIFYLKILHKRVLCSDCITKSEPHELCPFYRMAYTEVHSISDKRLIRLLSEENLSLIKEEYSKKDILQRLRIVNKELELKINEALSNEN